MAARFWVAGGTGNWSSTTNWSATTGGASGASVPGSADTATFNASSGAGTATVDSSVTIQTLTMTGFTGTLDFGTNTISLNSTGTVFTGATTFTVTGTPIINVTSTGSTAITVATTAMLEANAISFNFTGGTYALTFLGSTGSAKTVNFTGFSGTWNAIASAAKIFGDLTLSSTMTLTSSANALQLGSTTTISKITSNTKTFNCPITVIGVGIQLQDAMTLDSTLTFSFTIGTLDLNGKTLTTGFFTGSTSNTRTLAFGSTGNIICNGAGGNLWLMTLVGTLTVTGTPVVNISYSGATATTVASGPLTEAQAISFNFTAGTYPLTFLATASYTAKNVDFTGFAGTWGVTSTATIYGNLTLSTGMTLTTSASAMTFGATSGTKTITSNAKTIDFPLTFNGVGGTFQLQDALTMGATRALSLLNGTLDGNNKTISGASSFTMATGSAGIANVSTSLAFTHTSGTLTQSGSNSLGAYTFTAGTLSLSNYTLTVPSFSSNNANTRTIAFGTGNIVCNQSTGGTVWDTSTVTRLTTTGTQIVNIFLNGFSVNVLSGTLSETNSISFNFTSLGAGNVTFLSAASETARNVNFTGFTGSWISRTFNSTIYGNLTLSSGMSYNASSGAMTFAGTSGTQTITCNGVTINQPLTFNGVGGTFQLQDALLMQSVRTLTHANGTIDLNGKTLTVGTAYTTTTGTKDITFNGGTLVCPAATTTAFNNAVPTGFTTTAGTGTGKISMTAATAKTFVGGGSTFNCTLSNDGAGALTISGANTFTTIANGVQPTSFVFPIATTQTVTNWNVSGTAGNLVTITSGTAGVPALLSKASGIVSSNYLSLKDSTATGGATWYAGANSTNVSGNLGWIFSSAPATNTGNFFFMF